jgi:hypothetical protein
VYIDMTAHALGGGLIEYEVRMTIAAVNRSMFSTQDELGLAMIKSGKLFGILPAIAGMACLTVPFNRSMWVFIYRLDK